VTASLWLAVVVATGAVAAGAFALAVAVRFDIARPTERYVECCRNCDPDAGSEMPYCVVCRPRLGLTYPPDR
jgi:hypothetical protein